MSSKIQSAKASNQLGSMFGVDIRRMLISPMFYVMLGIALALPILILVMTSMAGGAELGGFTNAWQVIASESGTGMMAMDMTAMCNINLLYFMTGVFVCLFTAQDFSSGYAKNLFTVRAKKGGYIASKTLTGFIAGASFLTAFFIGTILGGSFAGLSFELGTAGIAGLIMCMLAKIFLMSVFVSIFLLLSVIGKEKAWLSIMLSLGAGMLLFMMIPMMTPLDSSVMNVGMCLAGGAIFSAGIGCISNLILKKTSLVS